MSKPEKCPKCREFLEIDYVDGFHVSCPKCHVGTSHGSHGSEQEAVTCLQVFADPLHNLRGPMNKLDKLLEVVKKVVDLVTECSTCEGTGEDDGGPCPDCDSHIYRIEEWEVAEAVIALKEALEDLENV